ncbi:peptidoglycan-binding protein [Streptomyces sp. NPDC058964]|uniref:peptidoglycan-binding protein n=1 Tax=Streptomyces sp. NPDC058964 TaxID=3346681 RepID=UPI0036C86B3C
MSELRAAGSPYAREFTDLLQALKSRADCSYEALARRSGVSGSALQRYCSGVGVPNDFDPIARFGKACGADARELLELHRLWVLVDAGRRRGSPRAESAPGPRSAAGPTPIPAQTPATAETELAEMPVRLPGDEGDSAGPAVNTHVPAAGSTTGTASSVALGSGPARVPFRLRLRHLRRWPVLAGCLLVVGVTVAGTVLLTGGRPAGADDSPNRPLLSAKCRFVAMGHQDTCVRELQLQLKQAGLDLDVDGAFGPFTQMRVVVFQLLAGLEPNGVVDDRTKRALYSDRVKVRPWSPERVDRRVREVFTEDADRAGGIAKCASNLDPLYSLGNTNGTRNWGVFQLYDGTLRELGGTPRKALDPEWNIQAAHRLWARTHDFRAWPSCDKAYQAGASKSGRSKGPKEKPERSATP